MPHKDRTTRLAYLKRWRQRPGAKEIRNEKRRRKLQNPQARERERMLRNREYTKIPWVGSAKQKWRKEHPGLAKEAFWRRHGLVGATWSGYLALFAAQGGVCALCKEPPMSHRLAWDHDPARPQEVNTRGLLCVQCNTGIGWIENKGFQPGAEVASYLARF